ncbi:MAG: hypothetical protein AMJ61_09265 [Desulfobacterales bacterium SG8_35_2]|nr:MAG: hypothetical protein AMJ61_09265 [Desulfobacterales bacterium SG8_35_2]
MKQVTILLSVSILLFNCSGKKEPETEVQKDPSSVQSAPTAVLTASQANRLAQLPLNCIQTEYPNKPGQTLGSREDIQEPHLLHPAFYGCFDWHSAVHGHWSLVKLLKMFPGMEEAERIREMLAQNISKKNIENEVAYFEGEHNKSYERTYGWAWLLKLSEELSSWEDPLGKELAENLKPLSDKIVMNYMEFLPNLVYPIRVGEHTNTAFGLAFAWDYAVSNGIDSLQALIREKSLAFYLDDRNCPMDWEPGGFDFLSPCLEEIDLLRRVLDAADFREWIDGFAPRLLSHDFSLAPGEVSDRTDGKLVHLDGLNFSRAWVLYGLADQYPEFQHLNQIADQHLAYSLPLLVDGNYEGEHWLGTFAIYALSVSY